jgi:hypothetical protein
VKTVRFSNVVEKSGRPETHLLLVEPAKDRALQAAIKASRVMTVQQTNVGTSTDRGEIGFHPGTSRQFFVFPKSLSTFAGRTVIGIKYDLLSSPEVSESERAAPTKPPKRKAPAAPKTPKALPSKAPKETAKKRPAPDESKVVPFEPAPPKEEDSEEVAELKKKVRHAMAVLEDGRAVAAFNLLKRIVED